MVVYVSNLKIKHKQSNLFALYRLLNQHAVQSLLRLFDTQIGILVQVCCHSFSQSEVTVETL